MPSNDQNPQEFSLPPSSKTSPRRKPRPTLNQLREQFLKENPGYRNHVPLPRQGTTSSATGTSAASTSARSSAAGSGKTVVNASSATSRPPDTSKVTNSSSTVTGGSPGLQQVDCNQYETWKEQDADARARGHQRVASDDSYTSFKGFLEKMEQKNALYGLSDVD